MRQHFKSAAWILGIALIGAAIGTPIVEAMLQRPGAPLIGGLTSAGVGAAVLVDDDGALQVEVTGGSGGTVTANQGTAGATAWPVSVVNGTYDTLATFTTNGLFLLQNTSTNQATATTTLLQSAILTNNTGSAVLVQVMDGNGRYLLGPSFSIPANSQYVLSLPSGTLMTSGINISANTANAVTVSFWGLQ
jgi:hypothetical protein